MCRSLNDNRDGCPPLRHCCRFGVSDLCVACTPDSNPSQSISLQLTLKCVRPCLSRNRTRWDTLRLFLGKSITLRRAFAFRTNTFSALSLCLCIFLMAMNTLFTFILFSGNCFSSIISPTISRTSITTESQKFCYVPWHRFDRITVRSLMSFC